MRRGASLLARTILLLAIPWLAGCVAFEPDDLALATVQVVDARALTEPLPPGLAALFQEMSPSSPAVEWEPSPGENLKLKVYFTSKLNIAAYVLESRFPLGLFASFCGEDLKRAKVGFSGVYWKGHPIDGFFGNPDPIQGAVEPGQPITYYAYLPVVYVARLPSRPPRPPFDLRQESRDICFRLSGGNFPSGFRSNVVRIPTAVIEAALHYRSPDLDRQETDGKPPSPRSHRSPELAADPSADGAAALFVPAAARAGRTGD